MEIDTKAERNVR